MKKLQRRRILLSLLPLAILLCFVYGYSLVTVLFSAFTGFTGSSAGKFVCMKNFQLISKDIWPTVKITLIWTFGSVLPAMVAGLALAVFCNRNFKGKKAAVSINLIPYAIPLIIVASCWRFVYNPDFGVLNVLLSKLGLIEKPISFLGFDLALLSVIIARIWRAMPFAFMNYYSALTTIPKDLYEAAAIDGASKWQQILHVTLPNLRTMIAILFILNVGKIFNADFGLFWNVPMQNGALFSVTQVIDTYIYRVLMNTGNIGQSTAAGLLQNIVGFICIIGANAVVKKIDSDSTLF